MLGLGPGRRGEEVLQVLVVGGAASEDLVDEGGQLRCEELAFVDVWCRSWGRGESRIGEEPQSQWKCRRENGWLAARVSLPCRSPEGVYAGDDALEDWLGVCEPGLFILGAVISAEWRFQVADEGVPFAERVVGHFQERLCLPENCALDLGDLDSIDDVGWRPFSAQFLCKAESAVLVSTRTATVQ